MTNDGYIAYRCMDDNNDWIINKRIKRDEEEPVAVTTANKAEVALGASGTEISHSNTGAVPVPSVSYYEKEKFFKKLRSKKADSVTLGSVQNCLRGWGK